PDEATACRYVRFRRLAPVQMCVFGQIALRRLQVLVVTTVAGDFAAPHPGLIGPSMGARPPLEVGARGLEVAVYPLEVSARLASARCAPALPVHQTHDQ